MGLYVRDFCTKHEYDTNMKSWSHQLFGCTKPFNNCCLVCECMLLRAWTS